MDLNRLQQLRKGKGFTQQDVAEVLDITPEAYTQWERGKRQPSYINLCKLAQLFDATVDFILGVSDFKNYEEYRIKKNEDELILSSDEVDLIKLYRTLPAPLKFEYKGELKGYIRAHNKIAVFNSEIAYEIQPDDPSTIKEDEVEYIPYLANAAAGSPIEIFEYHRASLPVNKKYARFNAFAVMAVGDSMIGAGIEDGDFVVIRPQPIAENGEIVLVNIDNGEGTIKKLFYKNDLYELHSENPKYDPLIYDPQRVRIKGKVMDVIKKDLAQSNIIIAD